MIGENRNDGRAWTDVGSTVVVEPASVEEVDYVWGHLRPEEMEEAVSFSTTEETNRAAVLGARRRMSVYHRGTLVAICCLVDAVVSGVFRRVVSLERTIHALDPDHWMGWLRSYGPLADWLRKTDAGHDGELIAVTSTRLPRALDLHRHADGRVVGTVKLGMQDYWIVNLEGRING